MGPTQMLFAINDILSAHFVCAHQIFTCIFTQKQLVPNKPVIQLCCILVC